jgi:hypothetical protein
MIALTARLNERDETIIQLQEELDAYDRVNKESEEVSERRRARVKRLESAITDNGLLLPVGDEDLSSSNQGEPLYDEEEMKNDLIFS